MAAADVEQAQAEKPIPALPDFLTDADAVLGDKIESWRYGRAPDYTKTREVWKQSKKMNHEAGSLPQLVENLVKNWEIEASFKNDLKDWRTIDHENYSFAMNGGPPQGAEHMLEVGTYNAILAESDWYSPKNSDFSSSHKTFKRMMPTFAWEVIEVYSGPPTVAFKWRHWGTMKNDYVGFNDKGEKVTAKAHGGPIDILGMSVARVNDKLQIQSIDTYMDPAEMFKQIAPGGIVNKEVISKKMSPGEALGNDPADEHVDELVPTNELSRTSVEPYLSGDAVEGEMPRRVEGLLSRSAADVHPHSKEMEEKVRPEAGEAVVAPPQSEEARLTHEEMSRLPAGECPFLNRE